MADLKECADSLLSVTTIDTMNVADAKTLYTVPVGKTCILTKLILKTAGDLANTCRVTVGQVGALTDFVGTQIPSYLDAAGDSITIMPVPNATPVLLEEYAAATIIQMDVAIAGDDVEITAYLFGILDDA